MAQPLLCTIFVVPRTSIYDVRGDFREPETNPDYYFIATSRSARLEGVAESLMMHKLFDAWSRGMSKIRSDSAAAHQASKPCKPVQSLDGEEEAILDEEAAASLFPVRVGFRFSSRAVSYCLLCDP